MSLSPKGATASAEAAVAKDFLQLCLGGPKNEDDLALLGLEGDFFEVEEEEGDAAARAAAAQEKGNGTVFMAMADSDDSECEDDEEDEDIEDAYNFDPEMVAEMLRHKGFTMAELTEKFQESMAQALERRLVEKSAQSADNQANDETRPDCQGDVDGRMTPEGCMTPPTHGPSSCQGSPEASFVAERMERAKQEAIARKGRRSSAVKRDAIQEAMSQAVSRHRKSLVSQASKLEDQTPTKIKEAMTQAQKRHRLSISKAAETLDAAGLGEQDGEQVSEQLEMVQKAMEEARRRHRRSIAEAVEKVVGMSASATPFTPEPKMSASATPFQPQQQQQSAIQDRINNVIAAAHMRQHDDVPPGFGTAAAYNQGTMNCSPGTWNSCTADNQYGSAAWSPPQTSEYAAWSPQTMQNSPCYSPGYEQASPDYAQQTPRYDQPGYQQVSYDQTGCGQLDFEQNSYEQSSYGQCDHGSYQSQTGAPGQWQADARGSYDCWSGNGVQAGNYSQGWSEPGNSSNYHGGNYGTYDGGMTYSGEPGHHSKHAGQDWTGHYPGQGHAAWGSA
eukprot:TRINITY_DN7339_c0_g2_i1.p1 TRINITY_DN7339_c0_g2~~TRINITY_DN7339_c0_g2_i1.p1  ORF type:complete len:578 (+),score=164.09 TRINITY_DN7339_c0_g2_i1:59-1735(+)